MSVDDLLTLREVVARTGIPERTLYRMRGDGRFPEAVQPARRSRRITWRSETVDAWLEANGRPLRVHRDP